MTDVKVQACDKQQHLLCLFFFSILESHHRPCVAMFVKAMATITVHIKCLEPFIKKIQKDETMYRNFIIPYLYKAKHVSGDTPPIIRSLKLH
jgi:hypothetical protein